MSGARVLLCVSGGIAAYKAAALTSTLVQRGDTVDVIMTRSAVAFVGALTFSALTGRTAFTSLWDERERIPHIRLVREAHVAVVAPATANAIAKLAHGIADDLLTTALLAARIPIVIAPAMNEAMYRHAATVENLERLRSRGCTIVEPETGFLAERERGTGRLAAESRILEALDRVLARTQSMRGMRVAITAGPTREAFDPVRFVSNPATGATGIALAREAQLRGAEVVLILGPTYLTAPSGVTTIDVTTAREMYDAALAHASGADLIVATAAVSDYRPADVSDRKVKKGESDVIARMVRNPDIAAALGERKGASFIVGFAAETDAHETNARAKMHAKHLDAIAVNDVAQGRGFGVVRNTLTLLSGENGRRELKEGTKEALAAELLDALLELRQHAAVRQPAPNASV